jgi:hypothetical protein
MANHAARPLKFSWINCGDFAVVVQVVKWLVDAGEVLSVGKSQQLVFAKTICLVHLDLCRSRGNQEQGEGSYCHKMAYFGNHGLLPPRVLRFPERLWMLMNEEFI